MTNKEKYINCFVEALEVEPSVVEGLEYQGVISWDSVGHMSLIAAIEDAFEITMDTDDIVDFSSYKKGIELLKKYQIEI
ncbi:acyl carrier protein [Succinivibrio dextrinosolvens]|uniref:acyl carrier protein n=1 Tax=Succinivibrio dextrinosolvens TaxID=83771 RepID=UPI00241C45FE|nr:acyl carrier protein [Succinivibrio dextrinosolvens]MBE6423600.1 acyl carrier protein [Succinivibrio dextrinosolvens]